MGKQPITEETVTMVLTGSIDERCINSMILISDSTELAEAFIRTLVLQQIKDGDALDTILPNTQQLLERIADDSESSACIFMAYLWPMASVHIGMQDVCDSIDLWLDNHRGQGIIDHLRHIASSADQESVREHFRQMVAARESDRSG